MDRHFDHRELRFFEEVIDNATDEVPAIEPQTLAEELGFGNYQPRTPFFRLPLKPRETQHVNYGISNLSVTALLLAITIRLLRRPVVKRPTSLRKGQSVILDSRPGAVILTGGDSARVISGDQGEYRVDTVPLDLLEESGAEWTGLRLWRL